MAVPAASPDTTTRARVVAVLHALERPARADELAERLGIHRNTVRFHLESLEQQGQVSRVTVRAGRGRPHLQWKLTAPAGGERPTAGYADLARWLTRAVDSGDVHATGREIGRGLAAAYGDAERAHAAIGCDPQPVGDGTLRLRRCPYVEAALESPRTVCGLHRAICEGLAEALPGVRGLAAFEPRDPQRACCKIAFNVSPNR